jgi:hypothetical protein
MLAESDQGTSPEGDIGDVERMSLRTGSFLELSALAASPSRRGTADNVAGKDGGMWLRKSAA